MPTGTVHDEDDQGMGSRNQKDIGYIYVTNIRDRSPKKPQYIPFIQSTPKVKAGVCVTFETAAYNLNPASGTGDVAMIKIAVDVKVVPY